MILLLFILCNVYFRRRLLELYKYIQLVRVYVYSYLRMQSDDTRGFCVSESKFMYLSLSLDNERFYKLQVST